MPVAELLERLPAHELTDWLALYQLEPWGPWRDNLHHAQTQALLYNINRGKNQPAVSIKDFMYRDADGEREDRARAFVAALSALARPKTDG